MQNPKQWLKDVVVVKFHDNGYKGHLVLPPDIKHSERIGTAEVVAVGTKFRHGEDIALGDFIYIDTYLGTRRQVDGLGDVVVYDGEDVLGVVCKS